MTVSDHAVRGAVSPSQSKVLSVTTERPTYGAVSVAFGPPLREALTAARSVRNSPHTAVAYGSSSSFAGLNTRPLVGSHGPSARKP